MMKLLTDLCCGLILMALPSGGDGPEGWQKLFTQHYATLQTAMARRDTQTVGMMLTPDFVAFDINGVAVDARQLLTDIAAQEDDPGRVTTTQLLTVNINDFNNSARVVHRNTMRTRERDPDGRAHDVDHISIITDDWVRLYSVWQLRHRETAVYDQFVDGKQVTHRLRGAPAPVTAPPPPEVPLPEAPFLPQPRGSFP